MNILLDSQNPTDAIIKITLNEADYQLDFEKKVKEYAKKAVLKGFRPGKVPPQLIKKMYGKALLLEGVQTTLSKSLFDFIKEQELNLVGEPLPHKDSPELNFDNQKEFEFWYQIGIVPAFEVDSNHFSIINYKIAVTEEQIQERLENILKSQGKYDRVDSSEVGDSIFGILHDSKHEEQPSAEEVIETDEASEDTHTHEHHEHFHTEILLPLNQVSEEVLPLFLGLIAGTNVKVPIQKLFTKGAKGISLATGISVEEAEKLDGEFEFIVDYIERGSPAELNEDLYKKVFPTKEITTEEEFIAQVKVLLSRENGEDAQYLMQKQLKEQVIKNTNIEIPHDFLKEWLTQINEGKFTREDIEREYTFFEENMRWDLIKGNLQKEFELNVTQEDIFAKARQVITMQFGGYMPNIAGELGEKFDGIVNNYLQFENGKNYRMISNMVWDEKILTNLQTKAQITETELPEEDFIKLFE